jgi:hypothetical protein
MSVQQKEIIFKPYKIQYKALEALMDKTSTMIFFGGAARVSKSYLLCAWSIIYCLQWPGIAGFIGRNRMTSLRRTTLLSFFEVLDAFGMKEDVDYTYQRGETKVIFNNGSYIMFGELYDNPSSPNFERIMSMNLTFACVDETSEISYRAIEALFSRLSFRLQEYDLIPKMLIVSNPTRGWLYDKFYKPYKAWTLEDHKKVILGTPLDNPTAGQTYINQQMQILSQPNIERLLKGNWEWTDDLNTLFNYDDLSDCFYSFTEEQVDNQHYLSIDVANIGSDCTVLTLWRGMEIIDIQKRQGFTTDKIVELAKAIIQEHGIRIGNVVVDSDGLGVGVADYLKGCYHFKGASSAFNKNYINLRSECVYTLAEKVRKKQVKLFDKYRDEIMQELSAFKIENPEKDRSGITPKEKIIKSIGHSPDFADSIMMRMALLFKKSGEYNIRIIGVK